MDWSTEIENIRFTLALIGESEGLVTDDEIIRQLELYPSDWRLAAAALADHLAARAINRPTSFTATGKMSVTWADRAKAWQNTAKALRQAVAADDANSAGGGTVTNHQLRVAGEMPEDAEYAKPRRSWQFQ